MTTQTTSHSAFNWLKSTHIPSLNIELQEYEHKETGARHLHFAADDDQNVFLVAFRTVPQDSTGVAHILEHTTLCGSRRYPVRDPFFMMTRRSLNTFMNAFTSSDWTAYPFASRNQKDFNNLLDVYLDAVFFPTLDPLDFAQEGHRVEFAERDNPNSPLVFKGVVFNEMKGAMSSPVSSLWQALQREIFPSITYHHNSGGDPACIPDLSYEQLKAFHAHHYHPSNALFMTYGDTPAHIHQARFEDNALQQFQRLDVDIHVPDEQRLQQPLTVEDRYAINADEDSKDKTHIVLGWLLGHSTDAEALMQAHLLAGVLLENGASPLRHALESTELGGAPSPLCGLSDSTREMMFMAGLEGSNPEQAQATEDLILKILEEVAEQGVPVEMVEAVLHQLELSQREVNGDGFPYGLSMMVNALGASLHGADAAQLLDIDPILAKLREQIKDPGFIKGLVRELLDNSHRVRLTMSPDTDLSDAMNQAEAERLAAMKETMSEADKQRVIELAQQLEQRQHHQDDPEQLPKVSLEDVPAELSIPEGNERPQGKTPATWFARGTNGLVYQQLVVTLPDLDDELRALLPLYCDVMTEVGSAKRDYLQTQALHSSYTGGIGASTTLRGSVNDVQQHTAFLTLSGRALVRNHAPLTDLMLETFEQARFDELERIHELITQERMYREQRVTGSGHALAMAAAASRFTPSAQMSHQWNGLEGIRRLKALDDGLNEADSLAKLAERFSHIQQALLQAPCQLLSIAEAEQQAMIEKDLGTLWAGREQHSTSPLRLPAVEGLAQEAWSTSTQVNFCSRAYPCVAANHEDAPALMVLAGFLRNNFLHRSIREQGGAYGGGASFEADTGAFRFYSYRDPRLLETLQDFDASIDWLLHSQHEWRLVEEAILGVISAIDKPGSPAGEAKRAFHAALHGRTAEQRRAFRARVLEVGAEDLKRVAETWLRKEQAATAVISNPQRLQEVEELGLQLQQL